MHAEQTPDVLLRKAYHRANEPAVLLEIGLRLLTDRHTDAAREVFALGFASAPEMIEFDLGLGACLLQQAEFELARQHLIAHLVRFPASAVGHFYLATSLYELDQPDEMMERLLRAITMAPSNQQALTFFFNYMLEQGDAQIASDAVARFGDDLAAAGPRLFLSDLAIERGDTVVASGHLDRALRVLQHDDGEALSEAARLLVALGRSEECVELFEDAIEELPFGALLALGRAYLGVGEPGQATALVSQLRQQAASSAQLDSVRELQSALRQQA